MSQRKSPQLQYQRRPDNFGPMSRVWWLIFPFVTQLCHRSCPFQPNYETTILYRCGAEYIPRNGWFIITLFQLTSTCLLIQAVVLLIQIEHDIRTYWRVTDPLFGTFIHHFSKIWNVGIFFHISKFLNLCGNLNQRDKTDFGKLDLFLYSAACAKFYNPSEHLTVDEIIVLFIGSYFQIKCS